MNWRPISEYEPGKEGHRTAVFLFKGSFNGGNYLPPTVENSRTYGYRECTHFLILPELPEGIEGL